MKAFYKIFIFILVVSSLSCSSSSVEATKWTQEEYDNILDSVLSVKIPVIKQQLWADFDIRKNIIIKFKKDSILGIQRLPQDIIIPTDTITDTIQHDTGENNISNE